jgi:hypothetical protein
MRRNRQRRQDRAAADPAIWAKLITRAWGKTVAAIVAVGHQLLAAKAALPHGEFGRLFVEDRDPVATPLPFSQTVAERLMAIARHPVISKSANSPNLPGEWTTLHVLAKLPDAKLRWFLDAGAISANMTGKEAHALVRRVAMESGERRQPKTKTARKDRREEDGDPRATAEQGLRQVADAYLQRCPHGDEAVIEELLLAQAADCAAWRARHEGLSEQGERYLADLSHALLDCMPGRRHFIRNRGRRVVNVIAEPSTFPREMYGFPRTQRGAEQLRAVIQNVLEGKICGDAERRILADVAARYPRPAPPWLGRMREEAQRLRAGGEAVQHA